MADEFPEPEVEVESIVPEDLKRRIDAGEISYRFDDGETGTGTAAPVTDAGPLRNRTGAARFGRYAAHTPQRRISHINQSFNLSYMMPCPRQSL